MLREATVKDLEFLFTLYMHPDINRWLLYEEMPLETFRPIAIDLIARHALLVYEPEGHPVGMCKLVPQKYRNSHIMYLGGVAIFPEARGRGLGIDMLREAIRLCRDKGFTRIELTVAVENTRAIRLYEKLGFVREGILKNYTYLKKEGKYLDEQVMALILP
jgi:putative acetyltransferase